jgi:hypothetical protein
MGVHIGYTATPVQQVSLLPHLAVDAIEGGLQQEDEGKQHE